MMTTVRRRVEVGKRAVGLLGFVRRHGVWLGLGAVLAASVVSLYAQYAMGARLATLSPLAERARLASRVDALASSIADAERDRARRQLDVKPSDLVDAVDDNVDAAFRNAPADGVGYYFIVRVVPQGRIKISLYDPARREGVDEWENERDGVLQPFAGLARNASIQWFPKFGRKERVDSSALGVFDAASHWYAITRPIVDGGGSLLAVAGMIVDERYYRQSAVPVAFQAAVAQILTTDETREFAFTLEDETGLVVRGATDARSREPEATASVAFPFPGWRIAARSRGPTYEQLSRRQFALGVVQQILVLALLVGGGVVAARAWLRQTELIRLKSDFLSNVTHELQSPITSIQLYAELLRSGRLADRSEIEDCGAHVEREAARLRQLVANILDFAKMDAGRKAYRFLETDLIALTRSVLDTFDGRVARAGLAVRIEPPRETLPRVVADPDALAQVLANLLDNAVKYSRAGGTITVRFASSAETASVAISDEGVGIAPDEHERIFERFHRVGEGLEHDAKGSGIGLSIVRHVVEANHGRVTVESEPGSGSTFTVTLPALAHSEVEVEA